MNNKKVTLSILIPTYNREEYVVDALDSVLNQPFQDFEVICSDNGSSDNTASVLKSYAEKDSRVKVFLNDKNLGPVPNWKNCLDHATGEFIHWLWSDDWVEPNFYIDAFNLMEEHRTRVVSTWNYRSDNLLNKNDKYISWQFSYSKIPGEVAAKKVLLMTKELPVSPAAYIMPREAVIKHFYENIPEVGELKPVANGVGVDSLMVSGCCYEQDMISILQKPSVVFRRHENISTELSRQGLLSAMYQVSHMWFMSSQGVKLSLYEYVVLLYKTLRFFRLKLLKNLNLMTFSARCFAGIKINDLSVFPRFKSSKTAKFKK